MQIVNLNNSNFNEYGKIIKGMPDMNEYVEEHRTLSSGRFIERMSAGVPIIIDYDKEMTLLVIYSERENICFYLDRTVQIHPGICFSLLPLEETSNVVLMYPQNTTIDVIDTIAEDIKKDSQPNLGFGKLLTFFYQETSENFYFRGESHSPVEFVYVDHGTLHNIINGLDYVVKQQECVFIGRNEWHIQYSDLPVKFLTISFSVNSDFLDELTDKVVFLPNVLKMAVQKMVQEQKSQAFSSEYTEALFKIILIELIRKPVSEKHSSKYLSTINTENAIVDKALKIISEKITGKIVLRDLAHDLHISVPYLYKLFSSHLHIPPGQYIMKIKIEESKVLLKEGKKTVGEISKDMGFSSIQHYSRQFRNHCGMSPSEYIKTLR